MFPISLTSQQKSDNPTKKFLSVFPEKNCIWVNFGKEPLSRDSRIFAETCVSKMVAVGQCWRQCGLVLYDITIFSLTNYQFDIKSESAHFIQERLFSTSIFVQREVCAQSERSATLFKVCLGHRRTLWK